MQTMNSSKQDISSHYDIGMNLKFLILFNFNLFFKYLGNELFKLMLDRSMNYRYN